VKREESITESRLALPSANCGLGFSVLEAYLFFYLNVTAARRPQMVIVQYIKPKV